MTLVIGYTRVSAIEQEQGYGPDVQAYRITDYSKSYGLPSPEIVLESKSGESLLARQEIKIILARLQDAREKGIEAHLIFDKLDRLARDLIDQETVVANALKHGFRLHSTVSAENDTLNPVYAGDPHRVAIRQFFGMTNQLEKATIQIRLDGGLHMKAKQGGSTGGRLPFGYWSVNQELAIEPRESEAVARAFTLRDAGAEMVAIKIVLAKEFPDLCGHWEKGQVSRVLARRDLYQHGMYRTRLGVEAVFHPELVIYRPDKPQAAPKHAVGIDWSSLPDQVSTLMLGVICGAGEHWIRRQIEERRFVATSRKTKVYVGKATAQELVRMWEESRSRPGVITPA